MARKLQKCWLKLFTVFCSLYLAPLSHWVARVFGFGGGDAYAVTVKCYSQGGSTASSDVAVLECGGAYNTTTSITLTSDNADFDSGAAVTCVCPSDITKVIEYRCYANLGTLPIWVAADSCTTYSGTYTTTCQTNQERIGGYCTNLCTDTLVDVGGYVLVPGSLQTYVSFNP